jgi:hypothetical protein
MRRPVVAISAAAVSVVLVPLAVIAGWAQHTLFDADRLADTLTPAATSAALADQVADKLSADVFAAVSPGVIEPYLAITYEARIDQLMDSTVRSAEGQQIIQRAMRSAHPAAMKLLDGSSPSLRIDLSPLADRVVERMANEFQLAPALPDSDYGSFDVTRRDITGRGVNLRVSAWFLSAAKAGWSWLVAAALVLPIAAVALAEHRVRTMRRMFVGIAATSALAMVVVRHGQRTALDAVDGSPLRSAVVDAVGALAQSLNPALGVLAVVALVGTTVLYGDRLLAAGLSGRNTIRGVALVAALAILFFAGLGWATVVVTAAMVVVAFVWADDPAIA